MHRLSALGLSLFLMVSTAACPDREVAAVDIKQNREQPEFIDADPNRDVDILFIIDNSGSMAAEQASLVANFPRFIEVLKTIEGGLPNVHIGVVSTDLGAGTGIGGCVGNGDNGLLQNGPSDNTCARPSDRWISDVALEDGSRVKNYTGELDETFSCIARVGIKGCGFEQPLEAMRRALNGTKAENNGFLRPDALLAVVIISDEDDCSTENPHMFDSTADLDNNESELGFLKSHRCFEFGVQCDPDVPRASGPRQNCVPRIDSPFMFSIDEYVIFLHSLKENPSDVFVAGIIGDAHPVVVDIKEDEKDGRLKPTLVPSCSSPAGEADPAVRLQAFLDAFPTQSTSTTICKEDLSDALTLIAEALKEKLDEVCIGGDLRLVDGEPACTVSDVRHYRKDGQEESLLPKCNAEHSNIPCYYYELDPERCSDTGFALLTERGGAVPPSDTLVIAHCPLN